MADAPASIREVGILITPVSADDERLPLLQKRGTPVVQPELVVRRSSQARPGPAG